MSAQLPQSSQFTAEDFDHLHSAWNYGDWTHEQVDDALLAAATQAREMERLREELTKAADTFADISRAMRMLGRPTTAEACDIAQASSRALLATSASQSTARSNALGEEGT